MIILCWNCRGLGNPRTVQVLKDLVLSHRPDLVFLSETKCKQQRMGHIRAQLSFNGAFTVDAVGHSGGLAIMWKSPIQVALRSFSKFHIDVAIAEENENPWRWTGFYGRPERNRRMEGWDLLRTLSR